MDQQLRSVAGTVFSNNRPRLIQIKGIDLDAEFAPHMLYITNEDKPGIHRQAGHAARQRRGEHREFQPGTGAAPGADAICVVQLDERIPDSVLAEIARFPG
jgi:D-3-phosphoglycerate dehydrogenase